MAELTNVVPDFREPTVGERQLNRIFGALVRLGLGLKHNYLLQVRGRKSGRTYSMPVNVLDVGCRRYLIAPRGRTQWVRNAESAGEVVLRKGLFRQGYTLRPVDEEEKLKLLKLYLERFATTVQRYFPVQAGSPAEAFREMAKYYPAFELVSR
jgi:deazaflavin-dependent oxidoreductase (nitroreductase family)